MPSLTEKPLKSLKSTYKITNAPPFSISPAVTKAFTSGSLLKIRAETISLTSIRKSAKPVPDRKADKNLIPDLPVEKYL